MTRDGMPPLCDCHGWRKAICPNQPLAPKPEPAPASVGGEARIKTLARVARRRLRQVLCEERWSQSEKDGVEGIFARVLEEALTAERDAAYQRGLEAGQRDMRERAAEKVRVWLAFYPEDVFPAPLPKQHGVSVDQCSAAAMRACLPSLLRNILDLPLDVNPAPEPEPDAPPCPRCEHRPCNCDPVQHTIPGFVRIICPTCGCTRFVPSKRAKLWHGEVGGPFAAQAADRIETIALRKGNR